MNNLVTVNNQQIAIKPGQVVMVPLAMVIPTAECIYSPSNYQEPFIINKSGLARYNTITMKVAPENDIFNWRYMTAYWQGLSDYYLAIEP